MIKMRIGRQGHEDDGFTLYFESVEDIKRFTKFLEEFAEATTRKVEGLIEGSRH